MKHLPDSLLHLAKYPQFVLVKGKIPINPGYSGDDRNINPHDPSQWMDINTALTKAELFGVGIGFVFTHSDPFWFLDVDHCIDENGNYNDIAKQMMEVFDGAAFEVSSSGTGIHMFGCGTVPEHAKKNKTFGIEFYDVDRFVLLTGTQASGDIWIDWTSQIEWLVNSYFPPKVIEVGNEWRDHPVDDWSGPTDDDVLIGKMLSAKGSAAQIFGGKASIRDLWENNTEVLARVYPSYTNPGQPDGSSVDAALANHLAFWTGKDHARIDRLMRRSALVRPKWDNHKSYMTMTITSSVNGCRHVYNSDPQRAHLEGLMERSAKVFDDTLYEEMTKGEGLEPELTTGVQFMSASQQIDYFKDCVYIGRNHGVLVPNGSILKPEQFKARYSGYTFAIDAGNEKVTKNAWEAFIDNQAIRFPKVDGTCFRPGVSALSVVNEEGFSLINTYVPIDVDRQSGDPSPFIDHLHRLFPNTNDYEVIMSYMAAVVQHQGSKFQWCPIIQGGEGNGKTMISRVIEKAVGSRYTHYPNAADLAGNGLKFNGWIEGKVFVGIEEIYVSDRRELTEPLKVFVTNDRLEIQHKGLAQYTGDNLANIIMYSNHKDCMKMTYDQRRYFMVFTGQQTAQDLLNQGMTELYFMELYNWLKSGGYAIMAEYLWTYKIKDALNPATQCQRAPRSSSIDEAVMTSMGVVEQHVLEVIEEGRQGFRGGYISSKCLDDLLKEIKYDNRISPRKRLTMLEGLGYVRHPRLNHGRVDNPIMTEGRKSILYHRGDVDMSMTPAMVKEDYETKQGYIAGTGLQVVK